MAAQVEALAEAWIPIVIKVFKLILSGDTVICWTQNGSDRAEVAANEDKAGSIPESDKHSMGTNQWTYLIGLSVTYERDGTNINKKIEGWALLRRSLLLVTSNNTQVAVQKRLLHCSCELIASQYLVRHC